MVKGAVIFGKDKSAALSQAMSRVAEANPRLSAYRIYETPKTLNFVPASWGYPDRWFIHWDQFNG